MNTPTFKTQFDKLTRAYIENKIIRTDSCFCFVGNLLNNNSNWANGRGDIYWTDGTRNISAEDCIISKKIISEVIIKEAGGLYTPIEIIMLEGEFMSNGRPDQYIDDIDAEEALFRGFEKTLELLKQIHISKGENIEEQFEFKKRELVKDIDGLF